MVQKCAVVSCSNKKASNFEISFFKLPKDKERLATWVSILNLGVSEELNLKTTSICSDHFDRHQFKGSSNIRLKNDAVPTNKKKSSILPRPSTSTQSRDPLLATDPVGSGSKIQPIQPIQSIKTEVHNLSATQVQVRSQLRAIQMKPIAPKARASGSFILMTPTIPSTSDIQSLGEKSLLNSPLTSSIPVPHFLTISQFRPPLVLNIFNPLTPPGDVDEFPEQCGSQLDEVIFENLPCVVCNVIITANNSALSIDYEQKSEIHGIFCKIFHLDCELPLISMEENFRFCSTCACRLAQLNGAYKDMQAYRLRFETLRDAIIREISNNFTLKLRESEDSLFKQLYSNKPLVDVEEDIFLKFQDNLRRRCGNGITEANIIPQGEMSENISFTMGQINNMNSSQPIDPTAVIESDSLMLAEFILDMPPIVDDLEVENVEKNNSTSNIISPSVTQTSKLSRKEEGTTTEKGEWRQSVSDKNSSVRRRKYILKTGENKNIACPVCSKIISNRKNMIFHMATHTGVRAYSCNICSKSFARPSNLAGHLASHEFTYRSHKYCCSWCLKWFHNKHIFLSHVISIHLNKDIGHGEEMTFYHCDAVDCWKCFHSHDLYYAHLIDHSGIPYQCSDCDKIFAIEEHLQTHVENAHSHGKTSYCCTYCTEIFGDEISLTQHQKGHSVCVNSQLFPFLCDLCGRSFASNHRLTGHRYFHHTRTRAKKTCHVRITDLKEKIMLEERKKKGKVKKVKVSAPRQHPQRRSYVLHDCQICGEKLKSRLLESHIDTHVYPNGFQCYICDFRFTKRHKLDMHIRKHNGLPKTTKNLLCKYCQSPFASFIKLQEHCANIHTESYLFERPYLCKMCYRAFSSEIVLVQHYAKIHEKARCKVCDRQFLTAEKLKRHMSVHTGAKLHRCDVCGRDFADNTNLQEHMWRHKDFRPYNCKICQTGFIRKRQFNTHMQKDHQN